MVRLHRQYLALKERWLAADDGVLRGLCAAATRTHRDQYVSALAAAGRTVALDPSDENIDRQSAARQQLRQLDSRLRVCASLQSPKSQIEYLASSAAAAGGLKAWDDAQVKASELISAADEDLTWLPSFSIPGMQYGPDDQRRLDEIRSDIVEKSIARASSAVGQARTASGAALTASSRDQHQLDKQSAQASDERYSAAASDLSAMTGVRDVQVFIRGDATFTEADSAIGYAEMATGASSVTADADISSNRLMPAQGSETQP